MWTLEVFKARAFRLALGFALTISVATAVAFAFIYLQVSSADMHQVGAILVDEAAKSVDESETDLHKALELRLTRDIRRLDFVALIDPKGQLIFGNVPFLPSSMKTSSRIHTAIKIRPFSSHVAARTETFFCWGAACGRITTSRKPCCAHWRSRSFLRFC
jgi:hypothetical protein